MPVAPDVHVAEVPLLLLTLSSVELVASPLTVNAETVRCDEVAASVVAVIVCPDASAFALWHDAMYMRRPVVDPPWSMLYVFPAESVTDDNVRVDESIPNCTMIESPAVTPAEVVRTVVETFVVDAWDPRLTGVPIATTRQPR